jgi:hypothetical protein
MFALFLINFTIENSALFTGLCNTIGYLLYFGWFAVLGSALFSILPPRIDYSLTWFLLDLTLIVVCMAGVMILTDSRSYHAQGLAALPGFYIIFAMVHVPWFLAVTQVAIEKERKPEFGFYFGTLLLLLWWPLGVWFVQPRLNRIYRKAQMNA